MRKVFIGGSRTASRLNGKVKMRLDSICDQNMTVFVGDANGADKSVQSYLAHRRYRNVVVYCSNQACRNNIGPWKLKSIPTNASPGTRRFFEAKDDAMAHDASYGFMIWDKRSKGTINNAIMLLESGKSVLVFTTPDGAFQTLTDLPELEGFLRDCGQLKLLSSRRDNVPQATLFEPTKGPGARYQEE